MLVTEPKVSVSIITYNHRDYISQAIDSVLAQQVDFAYEIIIGDDYSTDGTREILLSYQQQHPDIIQLVLHPRRYAGVPGRLNNITNLYACRGRYVAMLDGDDYWISHDKLQRQVDFLEQHPEYVLVFHDAIRVSDNSAFEDYPYSKKHEFLQSDRSFTCEDILAYGSFMPTSSVVFRNNLIEEFPEWFWGIVSADYAMQLLLSQRGKVRYFYRADSIYLIHDSSFMTMHYFNPDTLKLKIEELQLYRKVFLPLKPDKHLFRRLVLTHKINKRIAGFSYILMKRMRKEKRYIPMLAHLLRSSVADGGFVFYANMFFSKIRNVGFTRLQKLFF